jgi:hypothetical protein
MPAAAAIGLSAAASIGLSAASMGGPLVELAVQAEVGGDLPHLASLVGEDEASGHA